MTQKVKIKYTKEATKIHTNNKTKRTKNHKRKQKQKTTSQSSAFTPFPTSSCALFIDRK
jgi:hypothetical protein